MKSSTNTNIRKMRRKMLIENLINRAIEKIMAILLDENVKKFTIRKKFWKDRIWIMIQGLRMPNKVSMDGFNKIIDILETYGLQPVSLSTIRKGIIFICKLDVVNLDLLKKLLEEGWI